MSASPADATGTDDQHDFGWTRTAILIVGVTFAVFIVAVVIGMITHPNDSPTIVHSWDDFYGWLDNSNIAGIGLGLLIPTIPLAVLAEVHHRRTTRRLREHNALLTEHHRLLTELHHYMRTGEKPTAPTAPRASNEGG